VLVLCFYICFYFRNFNYSFFFWGGALGLSVLVSTIRSHGNDYFQSYSVVQC
jgi:NADH-ubiquinone oxidoreductase chain 4L